MKACLLLLFLAYLQFQRSSQSASRDSEEAEEERLLIQELLRLEPPASHDSSFGAQAAVVNLQPGTNRDYDGDKSLQKKSTTGWRVLKSSEEDIEEKEKTDTSEAENDKEEKKKRRNKMLLPEVEVEGIKMPSTEEINRTVTKTIKKRIRNRSLKPGAALRQGKKVGGEKKGETERGEEYSDYDAKRGKGSRTSKKKKKISEEEKDKTKDKEKEESKEKEEKDSEEEEESEEKEESKEKEESEGLLLKSEKSEEKETEQPQPLHRVYMGGLP